MDVTPYCALDPWYGFSLEICYEITCKFQKLLKRKNVAKIQLLKHVAKTKYLSTY